MRTQVNVLLAIRSHAAREYLRRLIQSQQDMVIVGVETDPVEILLATAETEAQVVVLDLLEGNADPGICSHLLTEFPQLLILALSSNRDTGILYRQRIVKKRLNAPSDGEILSAIRRAKLAMTN
ncbi:MAG TPA: hypothetical protein VF747_11320 [Blastocatellia bacterium]